MSTKFRDWFKFNLMFIKKQCNRRQFNSYSNILLHEKINNQAEQQMYRNIFARIKSCGPITIADYMKEVLTHPSEGYYMSKDVFGPQGDFVTSPEISQMFGEIIGIWLINEWQKITDQPVQLVELGPGRGTLSNDILRVLNYFKLSDKVSLHLVEISPKLSKLQAEKICVQHEEQSPETNTDQKNAVSYYMKGVTKNGTNVFWYYNINDVPGGFSIYFAHEFFDALPIHKFQRTNDSWCEVMIDIDSTREKEDRFRYVLSKKASPIGHLYIDPSEKRNHLEISPQSLVIIDKISKNLNEYGGFSLIIDYGHNGENEDTFRAFRKHKQHDPLLCPGSADLTADVDFSLFKKIASHDDRVICMGPIEQSEFLKRMGIDLRLQMLMKDASDSQKKILQRGYNMIVDKDKMGACFKVLSMFPSVLKEHLKKWPVGGFGEDINNSK